MDKRFDIEFVKRFCLDKNIEYLDSFYKNGYTHSNFKCKICEYEWPTKFENIKNCGSGCPKCAGKTSLSFEEAKLLCEQREIVYLDGFLNKNTENHNFKCLKCNHKWPSTIKSIKNAGTGCPRCGKNVSKGENYIFEKLLKSNLANIFYISQSNRKIIKAYEIDILLQSSILNLAISYNGKCHYFPIYGKTKETRQKNLERIQKNDLIKEQMLRERNYKTIVIKDLNNNLSFKKLDEAFLVLCQAISNLLNKTEIRDLIEIQV